MIISKIISIDCDNVLNDLCVQTLNLYNRDANDNLTIDRIVKYRIDEFVKPAYHNKIKDYFVGKEVWKNINTIAESQYYMQKLVNDGHRVMITTATEPRNFYKKESWLERFYPFLDLKNNLNCIKDKQLLKVHIALDDYSKNLCDITDDYGFNITADYIKFCYDYPWNQDFECDNVNSFRIFGWKDFYEKVCAICDDNTQDVVYDMATDTYM